MSSFVGAANVDGSGNKREPSEVEEAIGTEATSNTPPPGTLTPPLHAISAHLPLPECAQLLSPLPHTLH